MLAWICVVGSLNRASRKWIERRDDIDSKPFMPIQYVVSHTLFIECFAFDLCFSSLSFVLRVVVFCAESPSPVGDWEPLSSHFTCITITLPKCQRKTSEIIVCWRPACARVSAIIAYIDSVGVPDRVIVSIDRIGTMVSILYLLFSAIVSGRVKADRTDGYSANTTWWCAHMEMLEFDIKQWKKKWKMCANMQ